MTPRPDPDLSPVRERLVASATEMFREHGIQAVSADRVIADVGTTKATFYRHFPTKDDLVLAYLRGQADAEHDEMGAAAAPKDPRAALAGVIEALAEPTCEESFRGCPFMNAAAEYADPEHPVRALVREHRSWWHGYFVELAERLGVAAGEDAEDVAGEMLMLRDGALFARYVDDRPRVEKLLATAFDAVLGRGDLLSC